MDDRPGSVSAPAASGRPEDDATRTGAAAQAEPLPDFRRLFETLPGVHLVVAADPGHVVVAVGNEYLRATMTRRRDVIG